jgi:PAS domain S-box-containing protein
MKVNARIITRLQLSGIIILISVLLLISGYYYNQNEKKHHTNKKYDELNAIGKLKADQLSLWIRERLDEVDFFSSKYPYPKYIKGIMSNNNEDEKNYRNILSLVLTDNRYQNIYILDSAGNIVFSVNPNFNSMDSVTVHYSSEVFRTGEITLKDFYYCPTHKLIHFEIFAPVLDENQNIIATVVFRINPEIFLYPLISDRPNPSRSEETYIVKRDGDNVLFLSPLRHFDNSKLQVSVPVTMAGNTGVSAVLGNEGVQEGLDYRKEKVFSDIHKISNTDWYIITEIDRKELFADFKKQSIWLFSAISLLILLIAYTVTWIYHRRQRDFYKELLEKRHQLYQAQEEYGAMLYSIGDGVITTDHKGMVKHMNPSAEKLTGWKESQARGRAVEEIFVIENEETRIRINNPVYEVLQKGSVVGLANHTILISKNGDEIPIRDSGASIKDNDGNLLGAILVFSDQTDERIRQKLTEIRLKLFEFAIDNPLKEMLTGMLDEICLLLKSPIGFFHFYIQDQEKLWLQTWSSKTQKDFCSAKSSDIHFDIENAGVWADAVRQKKPIIHNDFEALENKKGMPEGHAKITRELIVPVIKNNEVLAVVGIGNKPTDYGEKDIEILSFLADVAWEITEHKLNENRLRQSEERFVQLFERAPLGYQSLDENGNFFEINQAWTETLGYSKEEVIGKWFGIFIVPEEIEPFLKRFSEFKTNGKTHAEIWMKHKNGTKRLITFEGNIGCNDNGEFKKTHCILSDITESKQLEEKLKENERQLSSMVGNLPGFVYRCKNDKDWTMLYLSRQCKNITGYEPEDFVNNQKLTFNDIIKKEYQLNLHQKWDKILADKSFFRDEYEILTANNETKWVLEQGVGIFDDAGELMFLEGYIEDITSQKVFEMQLRESERKFKSLFHGHSAAKLIIDPVDGSIVDANQAAADFYGWSIEELTTMNVSKINTLPLDEILGIIQSAIDGKITQVELQHRKANGDIVDIENFNSKVIIGGKQFLHIIIHDITDRKKIEKALIESEEKNRLIMDNSIDAILLTKPDGSIISVNKAACKLFGMTEAEICNAGRNGLVDLEDPRLPELLLERKKHGFAEGELDFIRKDGTKFTSAITSSIFHNSKGEIFTSMILRDITERKRWEEELLIAKEKAEISDRLKSAFLANMSHEIRTPMNGIIGFLELLQFKDIDNQSRHEYIELVNQSGQRLLDTINDIVEISKIEAGEQEIKKSEVNISELMKYQIDFFSLQTKEKGIELTISEQLPVEKSKIETDKNKLNSILTNLIKNAIKFTTHGSIQLGNYFDNDFLVFYVKDTGCGIPPDKIDAVFERFIQSDPNITRPHEGSGLGLTIAKAYVNLIGGKIWVNSELNKGSTFYFTIPYQTENQRDLESKNQKELPNHYSKGTTILIAEDEEISFQFLQIVLKMKNIKTIRAINGKEAVQIFKQNPNISLILMDIKLPEMNGFEATKEIRKYNKTIPIIAQTAYALSEDKEKMIQAGCNDYIIKPIKSHELFSVINNYLVPMFEK